jgi:hypothetical protein
VQQSAPTLDGGKNPYAIAARFRKFLRVTDVTDGLDAVGRADLTLMHPSIRPLWICAWTITRKRQVNCSTSGCFSIEPRLCATPSA